MPKDWRDSFYARIADEQSRDHEVTSKYGDRLVVNELATGRAAVLTPGWAMYSRFNANAGRHDLVDLYGRDRWITDAGYRVMLECLRLIAMGAHTTSLELAELCKVHRSTVTRNVQKLTAWGVIGSGTVRGKYGGIVLFARSKSDTLDYYAAEARSKMKQAAERRVLRLISKCASIYPALGVWVATYLSTSVVRMDAHLDSERADRSRRLEEALHLDPSRGSGRAPCPAHGEGRSKTLSWKRDGNRLLVHCFAGCTYDEIRQAAGV